MQQEKYSPSVQPMITGGGGDNGCHTQDANSSRWIFSDGAEGVLGRRRVLRPEKYDILKDDE